MGVVEILVIVAIVVLLVLAVRWLVLRLRSYERCPGKISLLVGTRWHKDPDPTVSV